MRHRSRALGLAATALLAALTTPTLVEAGQRRAAVTRPPTGPVVGRAVPRPPGRPPVVAGPGYPGRPGYPARPIYPSYGYPYYPYYPRYGSAYGGWVYPYYPGFSIGFSFGYPWYGYGPPPAYGYAYGYGRPYGGVRLDLAQRSAEVYVGGYYVGTVDNFDGTFQQLNLEPGLHQIEVRAPGFEPLTLDVRIDPGRTVTYRTELQPARP